VAFVALNLALVPGLFAFRQYNPLHQVTTDLYGSSWFNPNVGLDLTGPASSTLPLAWGGGVRVDIPIYDYFKAGFETQILVPESKPAPLSGSTSKSPTFILAAMFKPQIPLTLGKGNYLAPYLALSPGLVATFNAPPDGLALYQPAPPPSGQAPRGLSPQGLFGFGASLSAVGGIEYFPIAEVGFFAEGGYRALLMAYPIMQASIQNPFGDMTYTYHAFWMWAPVLNFGIKINI
jgi:hypothetical protein